MAIVKAINHRNNSIKKMHGVIDYCCNPRKVNMPIVSYGISDDPHKAFKLNKLLQHGENHKRLYKSFVVSMAATWDSIPDTEEYEVLLQRLMQEAMAWWADKGYQTVGAVHSNTAHPHFHITLDTCNTVTGKQFSCSSNVLKSYKNALSQAMRELGLNEEVLQSIEITEEDMMAEDDDNYYGSPMFEDLVEEDDDHSYSEQGHNMSLESSSQSFQSSLTADTTTSKCSICNIINKEPMGISLFLAQTGVNYPASEPSGINEKRQLYRLADNSKRKVMCNIVKPTQF